LSRHMVGSESWEESELAVESEREGDCWYMDLILLYNDPKLWESSFWVMREEDDLLSLLKVWLVSHDCEKVWSRVVDGFPSSFAAETDRTKLAVDWEYEAFGFEPCRPSKLYWGCTILDNFANSSNPLAYFSLFTSHQNHLSSLLQARTPARLRSQAISYP
jgi:hypothetical protein